MKKKERKVHLAHCYQGQYSTCKYGDPDCPAKPKLKVRKPAWLVTVKDLKKALEGVDENLPIGCSGHYGEFHESHGDFRVQTSNELFFNNKKSIRFFDIGHIDIGEEPD